MRILIVGSGGREHALGWALSRSSHTPSLWFAPGNAGTSRLGDSLPISPTDVHALVGAARKLRADLTIVGPEAPLAGGIVDASTREHLPIVGPTRAAAQIEASKVFAKELMAEAGIPTPAWAAFDDPEAAVRHLRRLPPPVVVKADGLAAGKGVTVCRTTAEAEAAVHRCLGQGVFGAAGRRVIIEEALSGSEVSVLALTDGRSLRFLPAARDHKRLLEGDAGPNTGGMGAVAPIPLDETTTRAAEEILVRVVDAMARRSTPFRGVLYAGLMLTDAGLQVLEFNCRFGDPEAQVILPLLEGDFVDMLMSTAYGGLDTVDIRWRNESAVGIVLAAGSYPEAPDYGAPIEGLDDVPPDVLVFHSGTANDRGRVVTGGGRILTVVAVADALEEARRKALSAAEIIRFPGRLYRRDIGVEAHAVPA